MPYWIIILALLLTACQPAPDASTLLTRHQFLAFGTIIDVSLYGVDSVQAQQSLQQLEASFTQWHQAWQPWQGNGALHQFNQDLNNNKPIAIPITLQPLFSEAHQLSKLSSGLFDPALGSLIRTWGFSQDDAPIAPPDADFIQQYLNQHRPFYQFDITHHSLQAKKQNLQIDFGAYAKGYALNLAIEQLQQQGIQHAIINAGGDLRAIGQHGDRPWRIGIRHPRQQGMIAAIDITQDMSIFTSGDYERSFNYQDKSYHHIIDPRTGYPANLTRSVTVIHADAALADAAATALFIAGPKQWWAIAKAMGIRYVMLIDQQGQIHLNPAMQARIQFIEADEATLVLSQPL